MNNVYTTTTWYTKIVRSKRRKKSRMAQRGRESNDGSHIGDA